VVRTTGVIADNAVDLLRCEYIASVVTSSAANYGNVTIIDTVRSTAPQQGRQASERINCKAQRRLELFNASTGTFATGVFTATRSAAQYAMYLLTKRGKVNLSLINYTELFDAEPEGVLSQFDYSNDTFNVGLRERISVCLNAARMYQYMQGSVWRFGRDEEKPVRSFVVNMRTLVPQSYKMNERITVTNDFDSVEIKYVDAATNSPAYIRKRIASNGDIEDGAGLRVDKIELAGCRNAFQAQNRAELEIRKLKTLRRSVRADVLPDIMAVSIGERGGVINPASAIYTSGEVLDIDGTTLTISEPVGASGFIYIVENDGSVSDSVAYTRVSDFVITVSGVTPYVADNFEVQVGSKFVASTINDFAYGDYILVKRGKPDSGWRLPCEFVQYDPSVYAYDSTPEPVEPVPLAMTLGAASTTIDTETCDNVNVSCTASATGGTETYSYTWTKISGSGSITAGAATATATVTFTSVCSSTTQIGTYRCTVSDGVDTVTVDKTFSASNIGVDPAPPLSASPVGGSNTVNNTSCVNVVVIGSVVASGGSGLYTYSWSKLSGNGSITSGTTGDQISVLFTSVCPEELDSGSYRCAVSDGTDTINVDMTFTAENIAPLS